jgi:hypothetical protein
MEDLMARTETLNKVPNTQVAQVKQDFLDSGATDVTVTDNGDGTSNVVATFPD